MLMCNRRIHVLEEDKSTCSYQKTENALKIRQKKRKCLKGTSETWEDAFKIRQKKRKCLKHRPGGAVHTCQVGWRVLTGRNGQTILTLKVLYLRRACSVRPCFSLQKENRYSRPTSGIDIRYPRIVLDIQDLVSVYCNHLWLVIDLVKCIQREPI